MKIFRSLFVVFALFAAAQSFGEGFELLAEKTKVEWAEMEPLIDVYSTLENLAIHLDELKIGADGLQSRARDANAEYIEAYLPGMYRKKGKQIEVVGANAKAVKELTEPARAAIEGAKFISETDRKATIALLDSLQTEISSLDSLNKAIAAIRSLQGNLEKTHINFRLIKLNRLVDDFSDDMYRYIVIDSQQRAAAALRGESKYKITLNHVTVSGEGKDAKKLSVTGFSKAHNASLSEILKISEELLKHDDLLSESNVSNTKIARDAAKRLLTIKDAGIADILLSGTVVSNVNDQLTSFEPRIVFNAVNNDLMWRGMRIEKAIESAFSALASKDADKSGAFKFGSGPYEVSGNESEPAKWTVTTRDEYVFIRIHRLNTYLRRIMLGGTEIEINGVPFKTEGANLLNKAQRVELSAVGDSLGELLFSDSFLNSTNLRPLVSYYDAVDKVKKALKLK